LSFLDKQPVERRAVQDNDEASIKVIDFPLASRALADVVLIQVTIMVD
jgi:hypothetical protein